MILEKCDMRTFGERCKGKRLACYGIGREFERIIKNYEGYEWQKSIAFLVDASEKKSGQTREVAGKQFTITLLADFLKEDLENVLILVTSLAFEEIYISLNQIDALKYTECYLYHFMFHLSEGKKLEIRQTEKPLIPKVIHYCWFGGKEMPRLYQKCIESWKRYCPDYTIQQWDETNCDINETLYTRQAYEVGKMGFVPDYFRLKIIYENGGVYLDTDVELLKNIDDLLYNHAFCGLQLPDEVNLGLGFGACKGNDLIYRLLERYKSMRFIGEDGRLDETYSGIFQTKDLMDAGMRYGNRLQQLCGMTIYPIEVLSPKNCLTEECRISENSYALHHYDGSWVDGKNLVNKNKRLMAVRNIQNQFEQEKE